MIQDEVIGETRTRSQNNFDKRLFTEDPSSASLLNVLAPARSPQKCERYTLPELKLVHMEGAEPRQVIISETSPIHDVTSQIRALIAQKRELREEYSRDVRAKWSALLASNPKTAVWYKKTSTMAFRKAKWKKIPTGRSKVIRERVYLKARPAWVRITVPVDAQNAPLGAKVRKLVFNPNYRPYVLREKIVPIYQKLMLRPAGLRRVTVRVKQTVQTYDWNKIKPAYVVYKIERRVLLDAALDKVQGKLNTLYKRLRQLIQQPHRLVACSDHGYIPPSWKEYYYQSHRGVEPYEPVFSEAYKPSIGAYVSRTGASYYPVENGAYSYAVIGALGLDMTLQCCTSNREWLLTEMRKRERGDYSWPSHKRLPFEAKSMLYPRTVVGQMKLLDGSTDQVDDQKEALAASTVRSLRNKSDYVFNLPRSIGELKDSKQTFLEGYDFLRWLAKGTRTRNSLPQAARVTGADILARTGSASLAVVGAFLAWKFAIQPTIQDCQTFKSHTAEWLLATRRHLLETIKTLQSLSSNILHIRSKFRGDDAFRRKSLVNLAAEVGMSDDVIVEMTQSTVYSSPLLVTSCHKRDGEGGSQSLKTYRTTTEEWVPYEGCFGMENSEEQIVHDRGYDRGPTAGPVFSLSLPQDRITATCQFLRERWTGGSVAVESEPDAGHSFEIPMSGLDALKSCYERQDWPKAEVTGYLKNQIEGVAFARYVFSDVLEFLERDRQNGGLESLLKLVIALNDWDKVFDAVYKTASKDKSFVEGQLDRLAAIEASWDLVYVAWQLTPLSFVYDWFTTSESLATILNNFQTEYFVPAPPAMEGIWVTKRCELLAGRPGLTIDSSRMEHYVSEWWTGSVRCQAYLPPSQGGGLDWESLNYFASPKTVMSSMRLIYKPDREVSLARSGLYVAKRGEFVSGGWETFLPQIQVKLNTNKVGTLLGMLAGFIRPRK